MSDLALFGSCVMDISVRHLNGRLAAKLPPELPLGLVFVVGKVSQLGERRFLLMEDAHCLQCRTVDDITLAAGAEVRASGHLMFDAERLQYFLLARDVEVITAESLASVGQSRELLAENEGLLSALALVKSRAAAAPPEKQAEMPSWVKKLAPPETELDAVGGYVPTEESGEDALTARDVVLDAGLVSMLSAAMDSEEELELTPEMLAPYQVAAPKTAPPQEPPVDRLMDTAVPSNPTSYRPANREDTDWLVILLIISFFVLTIAVIVTIILLILQ